MCVLVLNSLLLDQICRKTVNACHAVPNYAIGWDLWFLV